MELNPLPEVRDNEKNEAHTLNTITMIDGSSVTLKAPQQECKSIKESYVKTLQKLETIATQQQQSMEETCQKLNNLKRKFEQFEASISKISRILSNSDGFYEDWNLNHDIIMSHEYVARNDLLKRLHKIKQIYCTTDLIDGKDEIIELLTSITKYGVSKYERFPSGGGGDYYVNIYDDTISEHINYMIKACKLIKAVTGDSDAKDIIAAVERQFDRSINNFLNDLHQTRRFSDKASFEKDNKLTWVKKDI